MAKYGPKAAKRTVPTLRDDALATVQRSNDYTITVTVDSPYDAACAALVREGLLVVVTEPQFPFLTSRTYGKGW